MDDSFVYVRMSYDINSVVLHSLSFIFVVFVGTLRSSFSPTHKSDSSDVFVLDYDVTTTLAYVSDRAT